MFCCLFAPPVPATLFDVVVDRGGGAGDGRAEGPLLERIAREFSPRVEVHGPGLVTLDIGGLGRLFGSPAQIGEELRRAAADRGAHPHIAMAATRTAAMLLALARAGVTVVPPGGESSALAPLSLGVLRRLDGDWGQQAAGVVDLLRRWGLRTLGDLAALPERPLSERLGQNGVKWRRLARGEDLQPLVATTAEAPVQEEVDLEWPVEGLEPLSFVLARLLEPLGARLAALGQAAVVLHLAFRLASRETATRELQLPAPMRDPKVLRTLILLHLEARPLGAGVDRVTIRVDTAPSRLTQFSLLSRALPFPEQMATLLARLSALVGEARVGAAALVDSHRPGAFGMARFSVPAASALSELADQASRREPGVALRRFRLPVPARVIVKDGRPVHVSAGRRGLGTGAVETLAGPWRTSGEWWKEGNWSRDEWDVALADGAVYRIHRDRAQDRWYIDGTLD
jgi:protein ImuB